MNNSIAFAKWFINKHSNTGILVDGNDLQFILSQLDQSSWDEFSAINSVKDTVDNLIPILVPPMPKTKRAPKATTTDENIKSEDKQVKQVKKRAPKAAKISDTPLVEGIGFTDFEEGSKSEIFRRCDAGASNENDNSDIVKPDGKQLKDVKKRAPKAAKISDSTTVEEGGDVKKEVKKRAPKAAKISDIIGFTDFEEGSKSEIFRRCDIGASNENQVPVAVIPVEFNHTENIVQSVAVTPSENIVQSVAVEKVVKKREPKVKNELPIDKKEPKKRGPKAAKISIPVTEPLSENTPGTVDVIIPNEEHAKLTLIMPEEQELQEDLVLTEVFIDDVLFYTDVEGNFYNNAFEKIQNPY